MNSDDAYECALSRMQRSAPELRDGSPNHAPMVAEALVALGRSNAVEEWLDGYEPLTKALPVRPEDSRLTDDFAWRPALGRRDLAPEWEVFFEREIAECGWTTALERWLPILLPGTMATGTHALIRCSHVTRALEARVTTLRLRELALTLAYGASRYKELLAAPELSGSEDIETIAWELSHLIPDIDRRGPPPGVVKQLRFRPEFSLAVSRAKTPTNVDDALLNLSRLGATLYLRNAERHPLVFGHAVTGPAALRLLLPRLPAQSGRDAYACMWQAVAAWTAAYGIAASPAPSAAAPPSWELLVEAAVRSADAHAIKFTEACQREQSSGSATDVYAAMAADWIHRLGQSSGWTSEQRLAAGITVR